MNLVISLVMNLSANLVMNLGCQDLAKNLEVVVIHLMIKPLTDIPLT